MFSVACVICQCSDDNDVVVIDCDWVRSVVVGVDVCFGFDGCECCCECVCWEGFDVYESVVVVVVVVVIFVGLNDLVECLKNVFGCVSVVGVVKKMDGTRTLRGGGWWV